MIVNAFPASWRTDVTIHRGGLDAKGNPLPVSDITIAGCLVGMRSTSDPVDRSDAKISTVSIYVDDPLTGIEDDDTFTVPPGPWPAGLFHLDGDPRPCPLGLEIPVRKD